VAAAQSALLPRAAPLLLPLASAAAARRHCCVAWAAAVPLVLRTQGGLPWWG
jgi:hypothetical protein